MAPTTALCFLLCVSLAAGQSEGDLSLEEKIFEDIERMFDLFPQEVFEGYVTFIDLYNYFLRYDVDNDGGDLAVDEVEYANGLVADLNVTEFQARAYFKKFNLRRYEFNPDRQEVITEEDLFLFLARHAWLDEGLESDGFVFSFGIDNLEHAWIVMFMKYATRDTVPVNYNDYLSFDTSAENPGDWQKLFDAIDGDGNGLATQDEFDEFFVGGGYGLNETSAFWFAACDILPDGQVDRTTEWSTVFTNLNFIPAVPGEDEVLEYDEFRFMYEYIYEIPFPRNDKEGATFTVEGHKQLLRNKGVY